MRVSGFSFLFTVLMLAATAAQASSIVYRPTNPSFGGDPFNGSYLLGIANANNHYVKPREETNPLDNFERTITSSLLNRISLQIADRIFGEDAQDSGQFQVGNTILSFQRNGENVDITIFDGVTGQQTTISVPAPQL